MSTARVVRIPIALLGSIALGTAGLSLPFFLLGCAESPTNSIEQPQHLTAQPTPAGAIGPASGSPLIDTFDTTIGHTIVYSLGSDAEMVIQFSARAGLQPGGSDGSPVLATVIARRDTIYSYDQYGNRFLPPQVGIINTSALLGTSSSDTLIYQPGIRLQRWRPQ
jgi:hypothetical protein